MMRSPTLWICAGLMLWWLAACDSTSTPTASPDGLVEASSLAAQDDDILVYVDGSPISRDDMDAARIRFMGDTAGLFALETAERRLLDSLIASRAIATLSEKGLTDTEKSDLRRKVATFREELLVKHYLSAQATAQPVTQEMVQDYYRQHPGDFGGGSEYVFEYIATVGPIGVEERADFLRLLSGVDTQQDWAAWVRQQNPRRLTHRLATSRADILEQPLRQLVENTAEGGTSAIHNGDRLLRVRVRQVRQLPPTPLQQVQGEIRDRLGPMLVRRAIRQLSDEVVGQATVEYPPGSPFGAASNP